MPVVTGKLMVFWKMEIHAIKMSVGGLLSHRMGFLVFWVDVKVPTFHGCRKKKDRVVAALC